MTLYDPLGHSEYRAIMRERDFQIACHQAADEGAKPHPLMEGGPIFEPSAPVLAKVSVSLPRQEQPYCSMRHDARQTTGHDQQAQESTAEISRENGSGAPAAEGSDLHGRGLHQDTSEREPGDKPALVTCLGLIEPARAASLGIPGPNPESVKPRYVSSSGNHAHDSTSGHLLAGASGQTWQTGGKPVTNSGNDTKLSGGGLME